MWLDTREYWKSDVLMRYFVSSTSIDGIEVADALATVYITPFVAPIDCLWILLAGADLFLMQSFVAAVIHNDASRILR